MSTQYQGIVTPPSYDDVNNGTWWEYYNDEAGEIYYMGKKRDVFVVGCVLLFGGIGADTCHELGELNKDTYEEAVKKLKKIVRDED